MKKSLKIALLLIVVMVVAVWGVWMNFGDRAADASTLTLYGNVDIRQVTLGFGANGRIGEMRFEEGDPVTKGTVLAVLEKGHLEDNLALFEAQAGIAEAAVAKVEAGTRPGEIALARKMVEEREITLRNIEQALARQKELVESGAVSRQALDDIVAQRDAAEARLESGREQLALAEEGPTAEDIAIARAELEAARARIVLARRQLAETELVAPADGVILTRVQEPGAMVATGSTVYTLSLVSPVWVRAYIAEPDLGRVRPGMEVEVFTGSRPGNPYRGQVGFISPVAEFTPKSVETEELRSDLVYRLRIVVGEPDESLRQGMPVTVRIPDA